jgi:hypothetical protein
MRWSWLTCGLVILTVLCTAISAGEGNRLAYLDEFCDPYYAGLETARLTSPQWVGEPGVEMVVVLSIDDLSEPERYEKFLRPIFERLKKIDGRAPVSMMTKHIDPNHPQLPTWFREGVSLETHTWDHPCPCLQKDDFAKAKDTFDRSVDQLTHLPQNEAVAFRMPCCDSMNAMSPRFYVEMFNRTTPIGNFLRMDSSVFTLFTPDDPALPRDLVSEEGGRPRFLKYVPTDRQFINYVENYPYPFVVGRLCWEIPAAFPDDWQGFNLQRSYNPATVRDMKSAIDAAAIKKGVYTLVFHPGGWIHNDQVIELIDHAVGKYGNKVKFLNFREVYQRLTRNLCGGQPLRADNGQDNGVRVLDVNGDGYMDVVIGNPQARQTRLWSPETGAWIVADFPVQIVEVDPQGNRRDAGVHFGVLTKDGRASVVVRSETQSGMWHFDGRGWVAQANGLAGLESDGPVFTSQAGSDRGVRLRDLDGDGICELIVGNEKQQGVFCWSAEKQSWQRLPFVLPAGSAIVDAQGRDAGLRLVDIDEDGHLDVVFSNAQRYLLHLFASMKDGWSRKVLAANRTDANEIPMIVRADGSNNGVWFKYRNLWVQNEDTGGKRPATQNQADGRSYPALLEGDAKQLGR